MNKKPEKGMKVYIPTSMYISHGEDDVAGGIATVEKIDESTFLKSDHYNYYMVGVKEVPGHRFNWNYLMENQEEWGKLYKNRVAKPDPDYGGKYEE